MNVRDSTVSSRAYEGKVPKPRNLLQEPSIRILAVSYTRINIPLAILDSGLNIVFKNQGFLEICSRFHYPAKENFIATFIKAIGKNELRNLYTHLASPERSYTWRGIFNNKARDAATAINKVFIYPIFIDNLARNKPIAYSVLFDDVTEEKQGMLRSMFLSLLEASKLKDNDTGKHIERVNLYSKRLAQHLYNRPEYPEVDMDFIQDIGFLAAMHDVGKIGTPDDILNKTGPLTPWEWTIMREHTINGAYILTSYPNPMAKQIALSHHEMWDGNGYPYKIEGSFIPLVARIVSISDVYDALRMRRSYKPAYDHDTAMQKIIEWRGTHFDPALIDIFSGIAPEYKKIYSENQDEPSEPVSF